MQIERLVKSLTVKQEDPVWKYLYAYAHFIRTYGCILPFHLV